MFALFFAVINTASTVFAVMPAPLATCSTGATFFFLPAWYEFLQVGMVNGSCEVVNFKVPGDFLAVGLAIVDMLLRLGGLAATIAIIASGVGYITAGGDVQKVASARKRIYNGLIGLAIVFVASAFVAFLGNYLAP